MPNKQVRIAVLINDFSTIDDCVPWVIETFGLKNFKFLIQSRIIRDEDNNREIEFVHHMDKFKFRSAEFTAYIKSPGFMCLEDVIRTRIRR